MHKKIGKYFLGLLILHALLLANPLEATDTAPAPSAPAQEPLSPRFSVSVGSTPVPAYLARICNLTPKERQTLRTPVIDSTAQTAFASFDLTGSSEVTVTCPEAIQSVKLLPSSSGITPVISGNHVTFTVSKPGQLTLEINGDWINSLHLFVNPPETNIPSPNDPNVIYYGPGVHEVESVPVTSGKTVYIAAGAVVYGKAEQGNTHSAIFALKGDNIVLRGRGIIDGSLCPRGTRSILSITGNNIKLEGVVLRDPCGFTMPIRRADKVKVTYVKIFGWRGNSDGMDICNSHEVEVRDCFLRTLDDLIVIKTDKGQGDAGDITVRHCVLWNEFAHALSLGAELREPITNVLFSDCDIIHDKGRESLLRVYNCDSARVKNITFENIRIEEARRLMSLWIGKAGWSKESERGHIENVSFRNISSVAPERPGPLVELLGFDAEHAIDNVEFQQVLVGGKLLNSADVKQNEFVHNVRILP